LKDPDDRAGFLILAEYYYRVFPFYQREWNQLTGLSTGTAQENTSIFAFDSTTKSLYRSSRPT